MLFAEEAGCSSTCRRLRSLLLCSSVARSSNSIGSATADAEGGDALLRNNTVGGGARAAFAAASFCTFADLVCTLASATAFAFGKIIDSHSELPALRFRTSRDTRDHTQDHHTSSSLENKENN